MRRTISLILTVFLLLSLSVCAFAEAQYTLHMDRNGKTLLDADGKPVSGAVKDAAVTEFYGLMQGTPVNWMNYNYMEFEVAADDDGNVSLGKQTVSLQDGTFRTSSNAEVAMYIKPDEYRGCGLGEVTFAVVGFDGQEVGSSEATTEYDEYGRILIKSICPNCDENQDTDLHMMICGHYYCEEGAVGHGGGACGTPGHMNCDGGCHDICTNCLKPLCSGLHGVGVCEHVHKWIIAGRFGEVKWAYCETCGEMKYNEAPLITLVP